MRRELTFSLLGFLGGFLIAAIVFWRPSAPDATAGMAARSPALTPGEGSAAAAAPIERGKRPVVVVAANNEAIEPVVTKGVAPKTAVELFHEVLAALPGMDASQRQAAVKDLVKKLRAAGPEGLQAVRDFFRAGQDVKFQGGYTVSNGRMVQIPSLRVALLDALEDWPGPEAMELTREILRSTPRVFEATMAIRQLEAKDPGAYRAEAIQTLQQLAAAPPDKDGFYDGGASLIDALGYFKAPELIPTAEKLVEKNGWMAGQLLQALASFPPDVRGPAVERLFSQPAIAKQLAANPWALQSLNYGDPVVSQNVAALFDSGMDRKARERFLENFGSNRQTFVQRSAFTPQKGAPVVEEVPDTSRIASLQSKLAFLDSIAPQCTTAVLQERLAEAREGVQKAIANPESAVKPGAALIQLGAGGNAFFGGGTTIIQSGDGVIVRDVQTKK
jgi:hypothetical protein